MELSLRVTPFSLPGFRREIRAASRLPEDAELDQVEYLASYLRAAEVGARSLIVEAPYVDRHYLEEYTGYYATALRPPPSTTTRIHVLSCALDDAIFGQWIEEAKADWAGVQSRIQDAYLGFIVVRPLPSAPIGRTILRSYRERASRCFTAATTRHRVHLAGFELEVEGLPFQQQDQAVGACATTAIWSALSRVMRADGGRAATPLAVTSAATRYVLHGRALPANAGLDMSQILGAIRELGYSPHVLTTKGTQDLVEFQLALMCYLRSGIPVILRIRHVDGNEAHAITVVGFREGDDEEPTADLELTLGNGYALRSTGMTRLYVHDDRLGPYARAAWLPDEPEEKPALRLMPGSSGPSGFEKFSSKAEVWGAIAPLYPKLRLTAEDLVAYASDFLPLMKRMAGPERRDSLKVELRFLLGGQYLRGVYALDVSAPRLRELTTKVLLSRYVGLIRFQIGAEWFADIVCDTTDIRRDLPGAAPVLAMLPREEELVAAFRTHIDAVLGPSSEHRPVVA